MNWLREERFDPRAFDPPIRTRLLILQPTPFCNIDCDYCYLPDRGNRARMSVSTARLAARRLVEDRLLGESLTVVWHAGEPLVLSPNYYQEAFAAIAEEIGPQCAVSHSIQTNATLIDDRWCELFANHPVRVGVSVDGPAFIHDRHRRTRSGKGTHAQVVRGLDALRRHNIPHHAIAVVTAEALDHADAIYEFFRECDIHEVGFNFDEAEGEHRTSSLADREDAHRAFLERMLAHMHASRGTWHVRELAQAFLLIAHGAPTYRRRGNILPENSQTIPFALISVGSNGDFSTFSPEFLGQKHDAFADFILGNVTTGGFLAAANGATFRTLWAAIRKGDDACRSTCAYFNYCGGGSPVNKLYENGRIDSAETLYCRAMIQRPFEVGLRACENAKTIAHLDSRSANAATGQPSLRTR